MFISHHLKAHTATKECGSFSNCGTYRLNPKRTKAPPPHIQHFHIFKSLFLDIIPVAISLPQILSGFLSP
jgi:hypothetical protein